MKQTKEVSIMEIERFAIHDGPGIRSTVFFQGCPLHCPWCANPESQTIGPKLMYNEKKCVHCGKCVTTCPVAAIEIQNDHLQFHREQCLHCKICEEGCLQNAIQFNGKKVSIDEIVYMVLRDRAYYEESGGGVTISGGECFVQFDALIELLKRLKEEKLHVAVETCGQTSLEHIQKAFPYVDLFLFDLKHTDSEIFHHVTGGHLETILRNISYISGQNPDKIILRVPVIPGFNYNDVTMKEMFRFAGACGLKRMHLLPYHTFGLNKYAQLGIPYTMECKKSLHNDDLEKYRKAGEDMGLTVIIGG